VIATGIGKPGAQRAQMQRRPDDSALEPPSFLRDL
jgi:hypothetical protein